MKRVLLALILCLLALGVALRLPDWIGHSAAESAGARFMERYTTATALVDLLDVADQDFLTGGSGDQTERQMRSAQRRLGKFISVERLLVDNETRRGPVRFAEVQFLGRFEKAQAIVKLDLTEFHERWVVSSLEIEFPPSVLRHGPEAFAERIALACVRRICNAEFDRAVQTGTEAFQLTYPAELIAEAMTPLLAERGALEGLGAVLSKPAGLNRRDMRVIALFKDGVPLGFDLTLAWKHSRWRVDDLSAEEALGATVPPEKLEPPVRVRPRPKK